MRCINDLGANTLLVTFGLFDGAFLTVYLMSI
jgi:hypothetical protein